MSADPGRRAPRTFTLTAAVAAMRRHLLGGVDDVLARAVWCRRQRRHLRVPGNPVVWVRGRAVPWAEWGARRGYFEVQSMGNLPYLRAIGAPVV
jgi:hypothetical protein